MEESMIAIDASVAAAPAAVAGVAAAGGDGDVARRHAYSRDQRDTDRNGNRPNHFVCFRVNAPAIIQAAREVQRGIVEASRGGLFSK
jgi:ABC-type methionine transport system permease subunit